MKKQKTKIQKAKATLSRAMKDDPDFAWVWHCNIAMQFNDIGVSHEIANEGATRVMKLCFDAENYQTKKRCP